MTEIEQALLNIVVVADELAAQLRPQGGLHWRERETIAARIDKLDRAAALIRRAKIATEAHAGNGSG